MKMRVRLRMLLLATVIGGGALSACVLGRVELWPIHDTTTTAPPEGSATTGADGTWLIESVRRGPTPSPWINVLFTPPPGSGFARQRATGTLSDYPHVEPVPPGDRTTRRRIDVVLQPEPSRVTASSS